MKSRRTRKAKPTVPRLQGPRVALFAFAMPGDKRSPVAVAQDTASALAGAGADVHVFTNKPPATMRGPVTCHEIKPREQGSTNVASARALCAAAVDHFARVVRERGAFHVAHAFQWSSGPAALVARRRGAAHVVVTFLDTVFSRLGRVGGDAAAIQVRRLEQQLVRDADAVIAASEPVRQELAWLYDTEAVRVRTLHVDALESVDVPKDRERGLLGLRAGEIGIAFAGDWSTEDGADLFMESASALRRSVARARFALALEDGASPRAAAHVQRRGMADAFCFPPAGTAPDRVLAACDVVIVPARMPFHHRPLFRAWRARRPVIVSRTGPMHVVQPGRDGLVVFPHASAVAETAGRLAADPGAALALGEAGRRRFEHSFTWSVTAGNLIGFYRDVAGLPARSRETIHAD